VHAMKHEMREKFKVKISIVAHIKYTFPTSARGNKAGIAHISVSRCFICWHTVCLHIKINFRSINLCKQDDHKGMGQANDWGLGGSPQVC
jgi:hypothetical protein